MTEKIEEEIVPVAPTIEDYKKRVELLEHKISLYELHGGIRAYYSLNRKLNEIADVLNSLSLSDVLGADGKDKRFERLRVLWSDIKDISEATQSLASMFKISGKEEKDSGKLIPFIETVAETRI